MKFAAAVFLSVALLHAAFAAPVAEANAELARRTSPGSGSYSSWRDIVDGADEVIDLTRRTSPGGGNYIGYHDIVNDASSED
ncbi:hypothetical protein EVJ58_g168 [Rhodofomes roseus]|uniref:Uncharacterized protein n=1 Tax=Rhodofomes roseus TaxID=34475 RepID=A0A4Y9Z7M0_9APHY|nr:hypothetical protein EVJ58_g168 [Rhodofomes roseus]